MAEQMAQEAQDPGNLQRGSNSLSQLLRVSPSDPLRELFEACKVNIEFDLFSLQGQTLAFSGSF